MAVPLTSHYYSTHYQPIQAAKYAQLWPFLQPFLPAQPFSLLDVGIGPAWLEDFLYQKGVVFSRVVGVDVSEKAITPRKKNIDYFLSPSFTTAEKFDVVFCFDAWHCFPQMDLFSFVKKDGWLLVSEPLTYEKQLEKLPTWKRLLDVIVGEMEKSRVVLQ